jgi:hypothetical protein
MSSNNKDTKMLVEKYKSVEEGLLNRIGSRIVGALSGGPKGGYLAGKANYYKTTANHKIAKLARELAHDLNKLGINVDADHAADQMINNFNSMVDSLVNQAIRGKRY